MHPQYFDSSGEVLLLRLFWTQSVIKALWLLDGKCETYPGPNGHKSNCRAHHSNQSQQRASHQRTCDFSSTLSCSCPGIAVQSWTCWDGCQFYWTSSLSHSWVQDTERPQSVSERRVNAGKDSQRILMGSQDCHWWWESYLYGSSSSGLHVKSEKNKLNFNLFCSAFKKEEENHTFSNVV